MLNYNNNKMKKYIILSIATLSLLTSTACMDDYLNEPSPSQQGSVTPEEAFSTKSNATAVIAGMLRQQRRPWNEYDRTDVGGLYSLLFARAVKGSDIQLNENWYGDDYRNEDREPTSNRSGFTWRFPYMMIGRSNYFIEGVEDSEGIVDTDKPALLAQAKAIRGFYYFQLALEFNHAYKNNPQAIAPPVYTTVDLEGKPMGTLEELYKQIISDLEYAVENTSTTRIDNSWVNKQVAAAMLANVYLSMENWSGAEEMAKLAYGGNVTEALNTIDTYQPSGFDNAGDKEWLWSMSQQADQSNYYFMAPHAFFSPSGYGNAFVNTTFYDSFDENDRRKEAMSITNSNFEATDIRYLSSNKFNFSFGGSMAIYRTSEFILVAAEAAARQGNSLEAQQILNQFKTTRYTEYIDQNLTGTALIDEILLERRKEMYGENGIQWFDAKRLQQGIERSGNHSVKINLAPNDIRFIMKVPQVEIDNNKHIDASVNNNR
jgi:hypothetical protein